MTITPLGPLVPDIPDIPRVTWDEFLAGFVWNQGEHVAMIGPTGDGKTTLGMRLLSQREYIVTFATKPRDETLDLYEKRMGFKKIPLWKSRMSIEKYPKRLLWPDARSLTSHPHQRKVFYAALSDIYEQGSWCVDIDELWWMSRVLGLEKEMKIYLQQGRSNLLSLLCKTQRPAFVPLEIYDQSTHLFFWADNDRTNLNRISGIGSFNSDAIRARVSTLQRYEALYINTREKRMMTFFPPPPE